MSIHAAAYRKAHNFLKFREDHDLSFTLIEFVAATLGTFTFLHELRERGLTAMISAEWLEVGLFLLLMTSIAARLFHIWRAGARGLSFRELLGWQNKAHKFDFDAVLALLPEKGWRGSVMNGTHSETAIKELARAAASIFSERTYGEPDGYWEYWEAAYLNRWHELLPDTIWHIPIEGSATAGYYSVALPITAKSEEYIERGHLPTALATIKLSVNSSEPVSNMRFLAYTAQYVPLDNEAPNQRLLLYTAVEHLSWLIKREKPELFKHGNEGTVSIICESSNRSLDALLESLSFNPVLNKKSEPYLSNENNHITSPAGFKLYKLKSSYLSTNSEECLISLIFSILRNLNAV